MFLIYVNDLSKGLSSHCKFFAEDTSLFSVASDTQSSAATLRNGLTVINNWAFQRKMIFNLNLTKQAQKVIFSRYYVSKTSWVNIRRKAELRWVHKNIISTDYI